FASWVLHVALRSDDRKLLVTCADHAAYLYDLPSRTRIGSPLQHERGVRAGEFSPSGRSVLTIGWEGTLRMWDAESGAPSGLVIPHNTPLIAGGFSHDGERVITGGKDSVIRIWDYAGRTLPERLPPSVISRDRKYLAM